MLARQGAGAKLRADQVLVSADGSLDEVAPAVASGLLPSSSALLGDQLDVAVPRGLGSRVTGALYRRSARWDDHVRCCALPPSGSLVDGITVVGAVCSHCGDAAFYLSEQVWRLSRIIRMPLVRTWAAISPVPASAEQAIRPEQPHPARMSGRRGGPARFIRCPVPDAVAGTRDALVLSGVVPERHGIQVARTPQLCHLAALLHQRPGEPWCRCPWRTLTTAATNAVR